MKNIKVPAKIKKTDFNKLTNYFSLTNVETATNLFFTSSAKIIIAIDGTAYMVGFTAHKNDSYLDCLTFRKMQNNQDGTFTI